VANLQRQSGISILGLIISLVIVIFIALLAFKLIPPFLEFRTQKAAIQVIGREKQNASVADIRRAWETRSAIDDFALKGSDLEITKQGSQVVISFAYRKEVPLFANVGLYFDFTASSSE
jgi:hypothetical protein